MEKREYNWLDRVDSPRDLKRLSLDELRLYCDELRHYGIGPKNLRQYVNSANRESAMFEQALVVYAKKGGGVEAEVTDETRERFEQAFSRMLALTDVVRTELIRRLVHQSFKDMEG